MLEYIGALASSFSDELVRLRKQSEEQLAKWAHVAGGTNGDTAIILSAVERRARQIFIFRGKQTGTQQHKWRVGSEHRKTGMVSEF